MNNTQLDFPAIMVKESLTDYRSSCLLVGRIVSKEDGEKII